MYPDDYDLLRPRRHFVTATEPSWNFNLYLQRSSFVTMQLLYYSRLPGIFVLLTFGVTGNAHIFPQHYEEIGARVSVAPIITYNSVQFRQAAKTKRL